MKSFMQEFKAFIARGNVMDMAVGVIIGGAFSAIVGSLTNDIIMPFIGIFVNASTFAELNFTVGGAVIAYGNFIQAIFNFLLTALVIFCIIRAINRMREKADKLLHKQQAEEAPPAPPAPSAEEVLLTEIRDLLKEGR